jgi:hypothetical protein
LKRGSLPLRFSFFSGHPLRQRAARPKVLNIFGEHDSVSVAEPVGVVTLAKQSPHTLATRCSFSGTACVIVIDVQQPAGLYPVATFLNYAIRHSARPALNIKHSIVRGFDGC